MSWTDIHNSQAAHSVRLVWSGRRAASGLRRDHHHHIPRDLAVRIYTLPTVREIPPVPRRLGTFDSTW